MPSAVPVPSKESVSLDDAPSLCPDPNPPLPTLRPHPAQAPPAPFSFQLLNPGKLLHTLQDPTQTARPELSSLDGPVLELVGFSLC